MGIVLVSSVERSYDLYMPKFAYTLIIYSEIHKPASVSMVLPVLFTIHTFSYEVFNLEVIHSHHMYCSILAHILRRLLSGKMKHGFPIVYESYAIIELKIACDFFIFIVLTNIFNNNFATLL